MAAGVVLRSDVSGKIQMKCFLTVRGSAAAPRRLQALRRRDPQGMPELKLGLNDRLSSSDGGEGGMGGGAPSGRDASKCAPLYTTCAGAARP